MSDIKLGHLIVLEGNEAVGKTTLRQHLAAALVGLGYDVRVTREPGGTPFAEGIRDMLLHSEHGKTIDPVSELLMVGAGRHDHNLRVIKPALEAGAVVICDRSYFSTFAYQVHPHERNELAQLFNLVTSINVNPIMAWQPIMVNLTLAEDLRQARLQERDTMDNVEQRDVEFHTKVAEAYGMLEKQPGVLTYNANLDAEQLASIVLKDVLECFAQQEADHRRTQEKQAAAEAESTEQAEAPIAETEEAATISHDEIEQRLLGELDGHAEKLEEIYGQAMTPEHQGAWEQHKTNLRKWVAKHREEMEQKGVVFDSRLADHQVAQISGNIGTMLGAYLTLVNIGDMVNAPGEAAV